MKILKISLLVFAVAVFVSCDSSQEEYNSTTNKYKLCCTDVAVVVLEKE